MTSIPMAQTMPGDSTRNDLRDLYRILLVRKSGSEFLATNDQPITFPCLEIPRWERVAEHLNLALRQRYGLDGVCLFAPDLSVNTTDSVQPQYQVMHARRDAGPEPEGTRWLAANAVSDVLFADRQDYLALAQAMGQMRQFREQRVYGPFGDPGWIDELFVWAQGELDAYGLRLTRDLQQLNASPTFALLRLKTNGSAVWFKAVGEPNLREFKISLTLSKLFPGFVPTVIATRKDWNGWLTTEFAGTPLDQTSDSSFWKQAVKTLALLQVESLGQSGQLLTSGCRDLRASRLLTLVDPFVDVISELMEEQPRTPPRSLGRDELRVLAREMKESLSEVNEIGIPDTLGSLDFNPGNILCSVDQCVFLDWAEAYVGFPFFTFEYLRRHLTRRLPEHAGLDLQVAQDYQTEWQSLLAPQEVAAALDKSAFLGVVAYSLGMETWRNPELLRHPKTAGYLRSLARRMFFEMGRMRERRQLCCN